MQHIQCIEADYSQHLGQYAQHTDHPDLAVAAGTYLPRTCERLEKLHVFFNDQLHDHGGQWQVWPLGASTLDDPLDYLDFKAPQLAAGVDDVLGALSTGERIYICLAANRLDILQREGYSVVQALDRLGPDWLHELVLRHRC